MSKFPHPIHFPKKRNPTSKEDSSKFTRVKLSPLARLYWTLDHELFLAKELVSDSDRYGRFIRMQLTAEQKRDQLIRSLIILDALVVLLMFGKTITIPGINLSLSEIPAAREVLTFLRHSPFNLWR